ncbi:MipA/OmpV family protein [Cronobacter malonaticus]|uniref:MipA/OmpV family protein n=1 Tax=Cronobacter malonaticus TaxID=413503 RepID=UPI000907B11B|nr:MipA/OmpV family protein [Cronobacter malonaticus]EGT4383216.1 MipA/OmpV family protein [Cronobacter malonaticus]EGT4420800.1 MipA/OmpV family protein [Cronobacter malonaticus]EGT4445334.1 MipA/OmpV family protein [Cronobacter malonaticus]EGT4456199.1 MipA/OmpV family protein [Cronobacter malonaticus]ELY2513182.1 MipA/OmpV family protein [Cronobacter malonaticus]
MLRKLSVLLLTFACVAPAVGQSSPSPFKAGVIAGWSESPYKKFSNKIMPLPYLSYDGARFFIHGPEVGLRLYQSDNDEFDMSASLLPYRFRPQDTADRELKLLDERKMSVTAGLSWIHNFSLGFITSSIRQRISGNKEGIMLTAGYGYPFLFGSLTIIPSTGIELSNNRLNNYYYGVSSVESKESGIDQYRVGSGGAPYVDIMGIYAITKSLNLSAGARMQKLSDAVYGSPMVENKYISSFLLSMVYTF